MQGFCRHCKKEFFVSRSDKRFCSSRCRVRQHRKNPKESFNVEAARSMVTQLQTDLGTQKAKLKELDSNEHKMIGAVTATGKKLNEEKAKRARCEKKITELEQRIGILEIKPTALDPKKDAVSNLLSGLEAASKAMQLPTLKEEVKHYRELLMSLQQRIASLEEAMTDLAARELVNSNAKRNVNAYINAREGELNALLLQLKQ